MVLDSDTNSWTVNLSTDGGSSWERILHISDDTGINEVHMDPRNPDVLYAAAYQRRRHVWTLVNGGPESGIYKSTDAGATWTDLEQNPVSSLLLPPFSSEVLVRRPDAIFADGFESGDTGSWAAVAGGGE